MHVRDHAVTDRLYQQVIHSLSPHARLEVLAEMARVIYQPWCDASDEPLEAAVVVGTASDALVVIPERRRAIDTWSVYVNGLLQFPLSSNSTGAQRERSQFLRTWRQLQD